MQNIGLVHIKTTTNISEGVQIDLFEGKKYNFFH